jgi:putative transcriptional regulator
MRTKAKFDPKFKSDAFEAIHSSASALFEVGAIDEAEMCHFDESCLANSASISPKQIKKIRQSQKVSQPEFARHLNVSESTVSKWESGAKKPSGLALKMLSVVEKHGLQILA